MLHHITEPHEPHMTTLLHLLDRLIQDNARLQQQLQQALEQHRRCAETMVQIRTPLTIIQTSANIIEKYHERITPEKRERHLNNIDEQVTIISDLIDRLGKTNSNHCHANNT